MDDLYIEVDFAKDLDEKISLSLSFKDCPEKILEEKVSF